SVFFSSRRRHTSTKRDWSSDVCSSDLGLLTGLMTGLLYTKGRIPILLAGILVMTGIYSINLRILGRANVGLMHQKTLFSPEFLKNLPDSFDSVCVGIIFTIVIVILLAVFLNTDIG